MASAWPWLAVAGLGALHGLNPANGWMFAAERGVRARDAGQARRALVPIAIGHVASVVIVACGVAQGMAMERTRVQGLAGVLLVVAAAYRWLRGHRAFVGAGVGHAGIALWSFLMATANGVGLMLVPALVPLCLAEGPIREITASGSLVLALAAIGVHTAAMLVMTGAIAAGVCRGVSAHAGVRSGPSRDRAWSATLAAMGVGLMALS